MERNVTPQSSITPSRTDGLVIETSRAKDGVNSTKGMLCSPGQAW